MASLATFAKLSIYRGTGSNIQASSQFRPEDAITVQMQYSKDLILCRGTLYINGTRWDSTSAEATQTLDTAYGGTQMAIWEIPGGTLADSPSPDEPTFMGYKITAYVEIWQSEEGASEENRKVIFKSNTVMVDMLMMWEKDLYFAAPGTVAEVSSYSTNTSSCTVALGYIARNDFGVNGDNDLQSYRFYLYDSGYNLVDDSGEQYSWNSQAYGSSSYTFYNLKDNTTYYLRARAELNGGYSLSRPSDGTYIPITVHYSAIPALSDHLVLQSMPSGVECTLDTSVTYTRFIVSRTVYNESDYLEVGSGYGVGASVTDRYAIPNTHYIYRVVLYNGSLIVATYYNEITYTSNAIKISDILGCYTALGDITKHPISRNDRGSNLEAMDSTYPYHVINGAPNYDSGSLDGIFSDLDDDCQVITDSNYLAGKADILRAWLNNGHAKLLTYYTGEAWIVSVSGIQTTDPDNNDIYHTTFNWTQIGDAHRLEELVRLGVVINNE